MSGELNERYFRILRAACWIEVSLLVLVVLERIW
jgi:hypothetical protein